MYTPVGKAALSLSCSHLRRFTRCKVQRSFRFVAPTTERVSKYAPVGKAALPIMDKRKNLNKNFKFPQGVLPYDKNCNGCHGRR